MRFSEHFNLGDPHQKNFDFVNIRIDADNRLFLDPTRIAVENNPRFQKCTEIIHDFFHTIFDLYLEGNTEQSREFFRSSGESNEVFLGFTDGFPGGRGNSEESLTKVFDYVHQEGLLKEAIVGRLEDFHVFVPAFGPDLLSDLVASLIKKELIEFTQEQCKIHGVPLTLQLTSSYWSHENHNWEQIEEMVPEYNGYPIVLIPKQISVANYLYDANRYWQQVVSVWRQRKNRDENSNIHRERPERAEFASKKEIRRAEITEPKLTEKQYLVNMTRENHEMIESFRANIENTQRSNNSNKMDDDSLESFINNSYELVEK